MVYHRGGSTNYGIACSIAISPLAIGRSWWLLLRTSWYGVVNMLSLMNECELYFMDNFNGGGLSGVNGMSRGSQIFFIWAGSVHLGGKPYRSIWAGSIFFFGRFSPFWREAISFWLVRSIGGFSPMFHCTSEFNRHRQTDTDI